eukprot:gene2803-2846_t
MIVRQSRACAQLSVRILAFARAATAGSRWRKTQPKMQHHHSVDASGVFSGPVGADLRAMLASKENVLAALPVDLSATLRFAAGWVVVTSERLLACDPGTTTWRSWPLGEGLTLKLHDHGGVGSLELHNPQERLAQWRFTLAHHAQALRLVQRFEQQSARGDSGAEDEADEPACPTCHTPLPPDTEECPACARAQPPQTSTWVLLRLWRFARPYRKQLAAGFALTLASTAATLVPPYLTIPLMDDILIPFQNGKQIEPGLVLLYLSGLLLSALAAWGLSWARTYILALVSERIGADLRTTTYEHLLRLSLDYFGGKRTGDLMARIGSETDRINVFLSLHALDFITDVLMIVMTAAILFSINPWLALVTLVPLPFIGWMIHTVRDRLRTGFEKIDRVWSEVTNVLADTIPGIRVVKAFAQEKREAQRFRDANQHNLEVNDKLNKTWSLFTPTVSLLTEIGLLVVWAFGIWLVSRNQITVGVLTAFIAYIGRFYGRLDSMSRIVSVTQKAAAGAKRIFDILDHVSNVPDPAQPVKVDKVQGAISMQGVDGIDIRRFAVADYRRHIGLVLQEPFLFFGTIAENIAYGKPEATREEIVAAARAAHAHEFILRLPHGYDSLTEKEIQKALDNLVQGRTTIAIAHRLSTLRKADRLVVMDRGEVVEVGPHDELMEKQGAYWRLYEAQARRAEEDAQAAGVIIDSSLLHPAHPAGNP